eukprot:COSAG06_NODE_1543_length_9141_cov_4.266202_6_plen_147_part_00
MDAKRGVVVVSSNLYLLHGIVVHRRKVSDHPVEHRRKGRRYIVKAANVVAENDASAGCSEKTQPPSFVFECCLPYVCPEPVLVIVRFLGSNGLEWQKEKTSFFLSFVSPAKARMIKIRMMMKATMSENARSSTSHSWFMRLESYQI